MEARTEEAPAYAVGLDDDTIIERALRILEARMRRGPLLNSPGTVRDYLGLKLGGLEHEVFTVVYLDSQHQVLECVDEFRGTVNATSVYPREIVRNALRLNASAVIFAHNHPSGCVEPSRSDEHLTQSLKSALKLVDVRVVDHFVVGGGRYVSFAERGLV